MDFRRRSAHSHGPAGRQPEIGPRDRRLPQQPDRKRHHHGYPAEFEQTRGESKGTARGRAGKIVYDFSAGTVTLSDDAWFSDGGREITSAQVVYDLNQQQANATSKVAEDGKRVKITINPQATKQNGASPTPAPPTGQNTSRGTAPAASPAPATP
ncbi:MAG: LptA/OstA family protein [Gammaproteobacteria bacterium]